MAGKIGPRRSLTDLAYEALAEEVYDRAFPPGAPVSIDALAEQLGISATPVREALVRAASRGLLVRESNKGFRVAPLLTPDEYHQLYVARRLLELQAASTARLTAGLADRLAALAEHMRSFGPGGRRYRDFGPYSRADAAFHAALVATCGNRFVIDAWDGLHNHLHVSRLYAGAGVVDLEELAVEHDAIVAAARSRDNERLVKAVREHIERGEQRLVERLPYLRGDEPLRS